MVLGVVLVGEKGVTLRIGDEILITVCEPLYFRQHFMMDNKK